MPIEKSYAYFSDEESFSHLSEQQKMIAESILKELYERLYFLYDVGLGYITLSRDARSISGGEAQRIRIASQIGSGLTGVMYVLDEPSIGLHQRDNIRLIKALQDLRDLGNSVLVVEHDKDMILKADHVIDIGPKAGNHGGEIISIGSPNELKTHNTLTADYLNGNKEIEIPKKRRKGNGKKIVIPNMDSIIFEKCHSSFGDENNNVEFLCLPSVLCKWVS